MKATMRYVFCFSIVIIFSVQAHAITLLDTFSFARISSNSAQDISGQLSVELWDLENGQVRFDFLNDVGIASSVSEIYFEKGSLHSIDSIINDPSFTNFTSGSAAPPSLPGGASLTPPFAGISAFSADTAPGPPGNGLNHTDEVFQMIFNLESGQTANDILNEMTSGDLRIGLHVRSIGADEESDSFVTGGSPHVIPEPSTYLLMGLGLVFIFRYGYARRRQQ